MHEHMGGRARRRESRTVTTKIASLLDADFSFFFFVFLPIQAGLISLLLELL
jgi:hypothetical protein